MSESRIEAHAEVFKRQDDAGMQKLLDNQYLTIEKATAQGNEIAIEVALMFIRLITDEQDRRKQ